MEMIELKVNLEDVPAPASPPQEIAAFWGELAWSAIHGSQIDRYSATIPTAAGYLEGHTVATLERLVIAILLKSPRLATGDRLGAPPSFSLRRPPKLRQIYVWHLTDHSNHSGGAASGSEGRQQINEKTRWKIIFEANARIHAILGMFRRPKRIDGCSVPEAVTQERVTVSSQSHLDQVVEKWIKKATQDEWVQGLQSQSPKQLWEHRNMIMTFQVWAIYRLATGQLRLHYSGAAWGSSCPQDSRVTARSPQRPITWPATGLRHSGKMSGPLDRVEVMDLNGRASDYLSARVPPPAGTDSDKASLIDTVNSIQECKIH
ncbi:hypothetical protein GQ600_23387 [Phytophthora cactorum]|nr:hypothetical protein GQ600_23387 [Phytophthora cactorum]